MSTIDMDRFPHTRIFLYTTALRRLQHRAQQDPDSPYADAVRRNDHEAIDRLTVAEYGVELPPR